MKKVRHEPGKRKRRAKAFLACLFAIFRDQGLVEMLRLGDGSFQLRFLFGWLGVQKRVRQVFCSRKLWRSRSPQACASRIVCAWPAMPRAVCLYSFGQTGLPGHPRLPSDQPFFFPAILPQGAFDGDAYNFGNNPAVVYVCGNRDSERAYPCLDEVKIFRELY